MEIASQEDINRYRAESLAFFGSYWITMFEGYLPQQYLIMEFLASKENKTIYSAHLDKFNKL